MLQADADVPVGINEVKAYCSQDTTQSGGEAAWCPEDSRFYVAEKNNAMDS